MTHPPCVLFYLDCEYSSKRDFSFSAGGSVACFSLASESRHSSCQKSNRNENAGVLIRQTAYIHATARTYFYQLATELRLKILCVGALFFLFRSSRVYRLLECRTHKIGLIFNLKHLAGKRPAAQAAKIASMDNRTESARAATLRQPKHHETQTSSGDFRVWH